MGTWWWYRLEAYTTMTLLPSKEDLDLAAREEFGWYRLEAYTTRSLLPAKENPACLPGRIWVV